MKNLVYFFGVCLASAVSFNAMAAAPVQDGSGSATSSVTEIVKVYDVDAIAMDITDQSDDAAISASDSFCIFTNAKSAVYPSMGGASVDHETSVTETTQVAGVTDFTIGITANKLLLADGAGTVDTDVLKYTWALSHTALSNSHDSTKTDCANYTLTLTLDGTDKNLAKAGEYTGAIVFTISTTDGA
jgi:hypothetical protein